jgi:hypothetical protein
MRKAKNVFPHVCATVDAHFVSVYDEVLRVTDHAMMALTMLDSVANHHWIKTFFERDEGTGPPTHAIAALLSGSMSVLVNNCEILISTTGDQVTLRRLVNLAGWLEREDRAVMKRYLLEVSNKTVDIHTVRHGYSSHRWEGEDSFASYAKFNSTHSVLIVRAAYRILEYLTPYPGREMLDLAETQRLMRKHCGCIAATAALCSLDAQKVQDSLNALIRQLLPTKAAEER